MHSTHRVFTRRITLLISTWCCVVFALSATSAADGCPKAANEIATDRPDVTNSSIVVPVGSLQSENGVNMSAREGSRIFDGTNSRLRLGVAPCVEVLVDLPTYFAAVGGRASSGFSDVAPAVKWQISPLPGKVDLSAVVGASLPTGDVNIAGPGVQPYLQFPWSWELSGGWSVSGMITTFFPPAEPTNKLITQSNFVLERKVATNAALFIEYSVTFRHTAAQVRFSIRAVCTASRKRSKSTSTLRLVSIATPQTILLA